MIMSALGLICYILWMTNYTKDQVKLLFKKKTVRSSFLRIQEQIFKNEIINIGIVFTFLKTSLKILMKINNHI